MKTLLALVALFAFTVGLRADVAGVKAMMDAPVVLEYMPENGRKERDSLGLATNGKMGWEIERAKGVETNYRELFQWLSTSQGRTSGDLKLLHKLASQNAGMLREKLLPALKEAKLTAAASDLEEALRLISSSKTLDRAVQDRFSRLARVASN